MAVALSAETGKPISEEVLRNLKVTWTGKDGNQIEGYASCLQPWSPEYAPMIETLMQSLEAKRLPKSVGAPAACAAKSVLCNMLILASHKVVDTGDRLVDKKGKRPKNRKMLKARMAASKILKDRRQAARLKGGKTGDDSHRKFSEGWKFRRQRLVFRKVTTTDLDSEGNSVIVTAMFCKLCEMAGFKHVGRGKQTVWTGAGGGCQRAKLDSVSFRVWII